MTQRSNIGWTDFTWNFARGCNKVDEDCKFCYMYRDSFKGTRYNPKTVVRTKTVFRKPLTIKEPSKIFASSLTDVFHQDIDSYRHEAWDIIQQCPQHVFQMLTKRPERILGDYLTDTGLLLPPYWESIKDRVWIGTSIGSNNGLSRLSSLVLIPQIKYRFLSLEPLHEPVDLPLEVKIGKGARVKDKIQWVIVGGESGNETGQYRYRPCELEWIERIVDQCREACIPVFIKQLGTHLSKKLKLSDRHGQDINEFPAHLQIQEFPKQMMIGQSTAA